MPEYNYIANNLAGKRVTGMIRATDTMDLFAQVKEKNEYLLSYEVRAAAQTKKLNGKELSEFNRELGTMLSAGITLLRAMEIMIKRDIPKHHRIIYDKLRVSLLSGISLSDAMEEQGNVFPQLLINMYRAAEANGTIDVTAVRMAEHYEREYRLQKKIKSAMTYPMVLMVLTFVIVIVVFTFLIPQFMALYADAEDIPGITKFMLSLSDVFRDYLIYIIIGVLALVFGIRALMQIPAIRLRFDRFKLKMPVFGKLLRIIATARFARTLSSLYGSGLSILTTLQISRGTLGNAYIASQFDELINDVRIGTTLAQALDKIDGFDKKLSAMVTIGEESGRLETMLLSVADSFDYEANEATQRMLTILEPLMIVIMALIIGTVIISVLLPIYSMYDSIGGAYGV